MPPQPYWLSAFRQPCPSDPAPHAESVSWARAHHRIEVMSRVSARFDVLFLTRYGVQRKPSPPVFRYAITLSMIIVEAAVQAVPYGSW